MSKARILVVDDEEDLCEILQFNLESEGYEVETAYSAEEALKKDLASFNLLMLDVMMGEISGFKMAGMIRKNEKLANLPIIFITAKDTENDMLTGFNIGADDYISKPFSIREVTVRVKAILRRTMVVEPSDKESILQFENLKIDTIRKQVFLSERPVDLTKKELEMLLLLVSHPGRVYSREDILSAVWSDDVYVLDRTIDVEGSTCETEQRVDYGMDALGEVSVTGLRRHGSRCGAETPEYFQCLSRVRNRPRVVGAVELLSGVLELTNDLSPLRVWFGRCKRQQDRDADSSLPPFEHLSPVTLRDPNRVLTRSGRVRAVTRLRAWSLRFATVDKKNGRVNLQ